MSIKKWLGNLLLNTMREEMISSNEEDIFNILNKPPQEPKYTLRESKDLTSGLKVNVEKCVEDLQELSSLLYFTDEDRTQFTLLVALMKGQGVNLKKRANVDIQKLDKSLYIAARTYFDMYTHLRQSCLNNYSYMAQNNYTIISTVLGVWNNTLMRLTDANLYSVYKLQKSVLGFKLEIYVANRNTRKEYKSYVFNETSTVQDFITLHKDLVKLVYKQSDGILYNNRNLIHILETCVRKYSKYK